MKVLILFLSGFSVGLKKGSGFDLFQNELAEGWIQ